MLTEYLQAARVYIKILVILVGLGLILQYQNLHIYLLICWFFHAGWSSLHILWARLPETSHKWMTDSLKMEVEKLLHELLISTERMLLGNIVSEIVCSLLTILIITVLLRNWWICVSLPSVLLLLVSFCIDNIMLICFLLVVEWLIGAALWKKPSAHAELSSVSTFLRDDILKVRSISSAKLRTKYSE